MRQGEAFTVVTKSTVRSAADRPIFSLTYLPVYLIGNSLSLDYIYCKDVADGTCHTSLFYAINLAF